MNDAKLPANIKSDRRRWLVLGITYICSLGFATTLQCLPPLISTIISDLQISHGDAGMLMSLAALPGVVISIPAGLLADRYGPRKLVIIAFVVILFGQAVFASGNSLIVLALGRLIAGAGAMVMVMMLPQIIARWFLGREIGLAMGIFNSAMPIGTIFCLNVLSFTQEALGWRGSVVIAMVVPLIAAIIFSLLLPKSSVLSSGGSPGISIKATFSNIRNVGSKLWVLGVAWMLYNAGALSFLTFTPDFLQSNGYLAEIAGQITSSVMWSSPVIGPVTGLILGRYGKNRLLIGVAGIVLAVLTWAYPGLFSFGLLVTVAVGLFNPIVPASIMEMVPKVVKPERLGFGFGIISTCLCLGIIIGPWIVGLARDLTGTYAISYAIMASFYLLLTLTMVRKFN